MISVAICSHNPAPLRLERVLSALRAQKLSAGNWELLLVDNASSPALSPDLGWHPQSRIVRESQLGLTHARLRAIAESRGELIVFVDDDNLLAADYLVEAAAIAAAWPILGAWGGRIDPEFTAPPPEWTQEFWHLLALVPLETPRWSNALTGNHAVPPGAGLCVRREVALHYVDTVRRDPLRQRLDRVGASLTSGGDLDLALTSVALGLGTGQFPQLKVTHIIPPERLESDYLLRLVEGVAYSTHLFDYLRGNHPGHRPQSRARELFERWELSRRPAREQAFAAAYARALRRALQTIRETEASVSTR